MEYRIKSTRLSVTYKIKRYKVRRYKVIVYKDIKSVTILNGTSLGVNIGLWVQG